MDKSVEKNRYRSEMGFRNQVARFIWGIVWLIFARPIPRSLFNGWKLFLLRLFGAKVHKKARVYSSVRIYMPWKLEMEEYSCLSPEVDCYNVSTIKIGAYSIVSQKTYLCAASHDIADKEFTLVTAPIIIKDQVWIAVDSYIGMGVTIGQGAVVGARSSVYKNVAAWTVVGGNPAKRIKDRVLT